MSNGGIVLQLAECGRKREKEMFLGRGGGKMSFQLGLVRLKDCASQEESPGGTWVYGSRPGLEEIRFIH